MSKDAPTSACGRSCAAPLITGNDLTKMSATTKATLTNAEVIAVDQDSLGKQGRVVATPERTSRCGRKKCLAATRGRSRCSIAARQSASITVQWSQIGIPTGAATVRDLWAAKDLGPSTGSYTATNVASHSVVLLKIVSTP